MWDDKNDVWEDIFFDNNIQLTLWAQKDDIKFNEILSTQIEVQNVSKKQEEVEKQVSVKLNLITYKYACIYFFEILDDLTQKKKKMTTQNTFVKKSLYKILSYEYFIREEHLTWKIKKSLEKKIWVTLSDSAK